MTAGDTILITNPASGRGRGARRATRYRELLSRHLGGFEEVVTTGPGHESEVADRALEEGYRTLIALGGDGTWGNVADRIVASGRSDVALGLLPAGTGNDFVRSLGHPAGDPEAVARVVARRRVRTVDIGRLHAPPDLRRHFLNVVGFGFDVAVIDAAEGARLLRGEALYKITALQQLFRYRGIPMTLEDGEGSWRKGLHLMLTISNGRFFGGAFPIAPFARLADGDLDACAITNARPLQRARLFQAAMRGDHVGHELVDSRQSSRFVVRLEGSVRFEVDGEVYDAPDGVVETEAVPKALDVIVP